MKNRVAPVPVALALTNGSADTLDALLSACSEMERRYTSPLCLGWPSAVVSVLLVAYSAKQQSRTCALCLENLAAVYLRLQRGGGGRVSSVGLGRDRGRRRVARRPQARAREQRSRLDVSHGVERDPVVPARGLTDQDVQHRTQDRQRGESVET
ncbi:hypothetical protein PR002_g8790 [Phytophthora rubi]|uniref:Uncharacterized protein n=1 Tax=Phytophthora rubi TaxID=129364 RepID=A0A6A3MZ06_9STRA|nr:hypothetical protein PR002_g8790 [Phytophthora rubi]